MEAELQKRLLNKAGSLLSRRSYSRGEMRAKLAKFAESDDIEATLDGLEALNLLNDAEYAYNFAASRIAQNGWGPIKVRHSLLRRHVAPDIVEGALERVRRESGDEIVLRVYLDRHCSKTGLPRDRQGIQKLVNHLRRRGFGDALIFSTLRRVIPDAAWEYFESGD
ncbi:MAG TPA: RecX family transcriptional regulator [Acidobacteriota bacterium]|nr:RecX family transcriptional regulator [Acidobacteriota bacterium]